MKNTLKLTIGILALTLGILVVSCKSNTNKETTNANEQMEEMAEAQYTCPMHSEVVQNEPGKCPKCGMTLVVKDSNMEHMQEEHMQE